jgi:hypothetical protein
MLSSRKSAKWLGPYPTFTPLFTINISGLAQAVQNFRNDVNALQEIYTKKRSYTGSTHGDWFHQQIIELFQMASSDADAMLHDINGLQSTLPPVAAKSHLPHEEHEYRI